MGMKTLILDIETAPNLVHVWGLWNQNVGVPQIIDSGYVMCWAAKWHGDSDIMFSSCHKKKPRTMLRGIHSLLDSADAVVHYNGTKFDIPTLNKEFLIHGLTPPAPYKQIDLLKTARGQFKFPSNKLDYVVRALKLGEKIKHRGHELWIKCMQGDDDAWKEMEEYNRNDVFILENLYNALKPWIKDHANLSLYEGDLVCPNCGSRHYQRRGYAYTKTAKYARFQCTDCGNWFRGGKSQAKGPEEKFVNL
jgi:hypothetical protein